MGRLRDDYSTVLVYDETDVFLAPSLADNLPNYGKYVLWYTCSRL
jgi:hypothetical protein